MRRIVTGLPAIVVLLAMTAVLLAAPATVKRVQLAQIEANVSLARDRLAGGTVLNEISEARAAVADAVMPSVVHIVTVEPGRSLGERFDFGIGASGAGWVWDREGHIITNAHVVEQAGENGRIRVELFDGRVREARVVGTDGPTDIAVLKVDVSSGLIPLEMERTPPRVGEVSFVFGSPFGIKFSMSQGTISGLNRAQSPGMPFALPTGYTNYIQTDAAMNPGNSGGPLVNADGMVIGMATAIANVADRMSPRSQVDPFVGQNAGIGFSIPVRTIENIVGQLLDDSMPVAIRGFLGVALDPVNPTVARQRGYDGPGVVVTAVQPNGPAAQSGLRLDDIVTGINGEGITSIQQLQAVIAVCEPGVPQVFEIVRGGEVLELEVRLGAATRDRRGGLSYLPGSENQTRSEIQRRVRGDRGRVD